MSISLAALPMPQPSPSSPPASPPPLFPSSSSSVLSSARARVQSLLHSSQWLGATSARQRKHLPKDLLIQRNLEIQAQQLLIDEEYEHVLSSSSSSASSAALLAALDRESDELAEESDEIETRLYEKYHLRGGGRMLLVDEMEEARAIGEQLARGMRGDMRGDKRDEAMAAEDDREDEEEKSELKEEAKEESQEEMKEDEPQEAALDDSLPSSSSSARGGRRRRRVRGRAKRVSRADRAVMARLDAQADENERRRQERAETNKDSLLGCLYSFFDEYVDGDKGRVPLTEEDKDLRRRMAAERRAAAVRSFPYILGTMSFPLFPIDDAQDHTAGEEDGRNVSLDFASEPPVAGEDGCVVRAKRKLDGGEEVDEIIGFLPFPFHYFPLPTTASSTSAFFSSTSPYPLPLHPLLALHLLLSASILIIEASTSLSEGRRLVDVTVFLHDKFLQRTRLRSNLLRMAMLSLIRLFPAGEPEEEHELEHEDDEKPVDASLEGDQAPPHETEEQDVDERQEMADQPPLGVEEEAEHEEQKDVLDVFSLISEQRKQRMPDLTILSTSSSAYQSPASLLSPLPATSSLPSLAATVPLLLQKKEKRRIVPTLLQDADAQHEQKDGHLLIGDKNEALDVLGEEKTAGLLEDDLCHAMDGEDLDEAADDEEEDGTDDEEGSSEARSEEDDSSDDEEDEFGLDELDPAQHQHVFIDLQLMQQTKAPAAPSSAPPAEPEYVLTPEEEKEEKEQEEEGVRIEESYTLDPAVLAEDIASVASSSATSSTRRSLLSDESPGSKLHSLAWQKHDLDTLYNSLRPDPSWAHHPTPPLLSTPLLPFQQQALTWMIHRETRASRITYPHPLYEYSLLHGERLYYQRVTGGAQLWEPERVRDVKGGILAEQMGLGKCFAAGTRLRLYNGGVIAVEDVIGGELLMGDDSTPRLVMPGSLVQGTGPLFLITPNHDGASHFIVNGDHILVLSQNSRPFACSAGERGWRCTWYEVDKLNRMRCRSRYFKSEERAEEEAEKLLLSGWAPITWEVSVDRFMQTMRQAQLSCCLIASGPVTFQSTLPTLVQVLTQILTVVPSQAQLDWAAWYLGVWVTDGLSVNDWNCQGVSRHPVDAANSTDLHIEIMARLQQYQQLFGEKVCKVLDRFSSSVPSIARRLLQAYGLGTGKKRIPPAWVCDSVHVRRRILSGIIDGDGCHMAGKDNVYEVQTKRRSVAQQCKTLAGSLGIRNSRPAPHLCTEAATGAVYSGYRVVLSGDMWDVVQHCAVTYKRCPQPGTAARYMEKKQDSRCYGFSITALSIGRYYGFAVNGNNRRFLLEDFTVTHNTMEMISLMLARPYKPRMNAVAPILPRLEDSPTPIKEQKDVEMKEISKVAPILPRIDDTASLPILPALPPIPDPPASPASATLSPPGVNPEIKSPTSIKWRSPVGSPPPPPYSIGLKVAPFSFGSPGPGSSTKPRSHSSPIIVNERSHKPEIKGTLIITPMSIVYQWQSEIQKHAPYLKVLIYKSAMEISLFPTAAPTPVPTSLPASSGGSSPSAPASAPSTLLSLSEYDVVLTNYSVLAEQVNYSQDPPYHFRQAKLYSVPRSPLLEVHWHRIVLDEAQRVQNTVSNSAKMAQRVHSTHRWTVTGTPIGLHGLNDIYGLILFLGLEPYSSFSTWLKTMTVENEEGMTRLITLLRRIMWRHSKQHVRDQISLPPLHTHTHFLSFNEVEHEAYRRFEYDVRGKLFFQVAKGLLDDHDHVKKIDALRQMCDHPQVLLNGLFSSAKQNRFDSMDDIGKRIITKAKDDAAETEREVCRILNILGLLCKKHGNEELSERYLRESWTIYNEGMSEAAKDDQEKKHKNGGDDDEGRVVRAKGEFDEGGEFDSKTTIVTANTQARQWRFIELVVAYHLRDLYQARIASLSSSSSTSSVAHSLEVQRLEQSVAQLTGKLEDAVYELIDLIHMQHKETLEFIERMLKDVLPLWSTEPAPDVAEVLAQFHGFLPDLEAFFASPAFKVARQLHKKYQRLDRTIESICLLMDLERYIAGLEDLMSARAENPALCIQKQYLHQQLLKEYYPNDVQASIDRLLSKAYKARVLERKTVQGKLNNSIEDEQERASILLIDWLNDDTQAEYEDKWRTMRNQQNAMLTLIDLRKGVNNEKKLRELKEKARDYLLKAAADAPESFGQEGISLKAIMDGDLPKEEGGDDQKEGKGGKMVDAPLTEPELKTAIAEMHEKLATLRVDAQQKQRHVKYLQSKLSHLSSTSTPSSSAAGESCPICNAAVIQPVITTCGHVYCLNCLQDWMKKGRRRREGEERAERRLGGWERGSCPTCRHELTRDDVVEMPQNQLTLVLDDDDNKDEHDDEEDEQETITTSSSFSSLQPLEDVRTPSLAELGQLHFEGEGQSGTKVDLVLRYLLFLYRNHPRTKSLVYSQFPRMLLLISQALTQAAIPHLQLTGSPDRAAHMIHTFQTSSTYPVLLLSLRRDSSGLTLVSASHVFLLEPSLERSVELQAVNRIHRIGQRKLCHVHRFVMKKSIEAKIERQVHGEGDKRRRRKRRRSHAAEDEPAGKEEKLDVIDVDDDEQPSGLMDLDERKEDDDVQIVEQALSQRRKELLNTGQLLNYLDLQST